MDESAEILLPKIRFQDRPKKVSEKSVRNCFEFENCCDDNSEKIETAGPEDDSSLNGELKKNCQMTFQIDQKASL